MILAIMTLWAVLLGATLVFIYASHVDDLENEMRDEP